MATGLGISAFLRHSNESGSRGQWLRDWRKKGIGEVTVWLHTRSPIVPSFTHSFMLEDEYEDRETGKRVPTLRYPRFVSPDPELVHRNQYFREDNGALRVPPDRDPFLLLREWLRTADHIGLEDAVFSWQHPKERKTIVWDRGELSLLVKRGKNNYGHTLDTKTEYVYCVLDNDNVDAGPVLMREGKLLSQKIADVIKQQQKQWGDDQGDPMQHPYAFLLVAEESNSPMNAFKALKAERAELTDEIWAHISSDEFPDPTAYGEPADGDQQKIRDAFEAAAQVDLPLDAIFSDDPAVRRELVRTRKAAPVAASPRPSRAAQARQGAGERPPVPKPGSSASASAAAPSAPAAAKGTGPQTRRRKVEAPPPPPPEPESIACDDCGAMMLATDTKCAGCGAEYEPLEDESLTPPKAAPKTAPKPATQKPAQQSRAKPPAQQSLPAESADAGASPDCWSCGTALEGSQTCPSCGIDQGDDMPF